jgi:putative oxidoreductase
MKSLFNSKYSEPTLSLGLLLLRLLFGGLMIKIGYDKMIGFNEMSKGFSDPFGLGSTISLILVVFAEFFCSIFLVLGLMTRLSTIPLIVTMSVAFFMVNKGEIYGQYGVSSALIFLAGYVIILFTGPGKYSLDKAIGK